MKKIVNIIFLAVFWSIPFGILFFVLTKFKISGRIFVPPLYLVFLIVSVSYKHLWSFQSFTSKRGTAKFLSLSAVSFLILLYSASLLNRSNKLYNYLKGETRTGYEGATHQSNDTLG